MQTSAGTRVIALEGFTDAGVAHPYGQEFTIADPVALEQLLQAGKVRIDDRGGLPAPAAPGAPEA